MDGLKKAIPGVKMARHSIKHPRSGQNIPGLGLQLPGDKGIRVMVQYDREDSPAPKGMDKTIVDIDPETGKKEVTDLSFRDSYAVWVNDVGKVWKANETRWIQAKDFRDPLKVVQFLKTKVKRMKKEEVEIDEAVADITIQKDVGKVKVNQVALGVMQKARKFGLKASLLGNNVRISGPKKKVNSYLDVTIGKSSTGDATQKGPSNPQIDRMLTKGLKKEEVEIDEKFAGWIAFYNREKYEIKPKKGEIDSLYDAKQAAIKHFKVPKSKQGLLAIKPAHEGIDIEKASMGAVIKDFQNSDAPQFKGKSDKKRREMAIAAKLSKEEKEEDDPKSKKKDKLNLKPKMDEKQMKKLKELQAGLREKRAQEGTLKKTVSDYHKKVDEHKGTKPHKHPHEDEQVQVKEYQLVKKDSKGELIKRDGYSIKYKPGTGYIYVPKSQDRGVRPSDIGRGSKSFASNIGRRNEEVVKEAVTTGGIEYGEQDWDIQHRLDQAAPYMDSNFAEFYEQGLEGPYIWHGETYFFDRKIGGWYSVTAEDYVDDEISKDLSLAYVLSLIHI